MNLLNENKIVEASVGLKVFVNLEHNSKGMIEICVKPIVGDNVCENYNLAKFPNPSTLGPLEINSGIIEDNEQFEVCVSDTSSNAGNEICTNGINGPEKQPEYVYLSMAELDDKHGSDTSDFPIIVSIEHNGNGIGRFMIIDSVGTFGTEVDLTEKSSPYIWEPKENFVFNGGFVICTEIIGIRETYKCEPIEIQEGDVYKKIDIKIPETDSGIDIKNLIDFPWKEPLVMDELGGDTENRD